MKEYVLTETKLQHFRVIKIGAKVARIAPFLGRKGNLYLSKTARNFIGPNKTYVATLETWVSNNPKNKNVIFKLENNSLPIEKRTRFSSMNLFPDVLLSRDDAIAKVESRLPTVRIKIPNFTGSSVRETRYKLLFGFDPSFNNGFSFLGEFVNPRDEFEVTVGSFLLCNYKFSRRTNHFYMVRLYQVGQHLKGQLDLIKEWRIPLKEGNWAAKVKNEVFESFIKHYKAKLQRHFPRLSTASFLSK
jgi:hypothetical protein